MYDNIGAYFIYEIWIFLYFIYENMGDISYMKEEFFIFQVLKYGGIFHT